MSFVCRWSAFSISIKVSVSHFNLRTLKFLKKNMTITHAMSFRTDQMTIFSNKDNNGVPTQCQFSPTDVPSQTVVSLKLLNKLWLMSIFKFTFLSWRCVLLAQYKMCISFSSMKCICSNVQQHFWCHREMCPSISVVVQSMYTVYVSEYIFVVWLKVWRAQHISPQRFTWFQHHACLGSGVLFTSQTHQTSFQMPCVKCPDRKAPLPLNICSTAQIVNFDKRLKCNSREQSFISHTVALHMFSPPKMVLSAGLVRAAVETREINHMVAC